VVGSLERPQEAVRQSNLAGNPGKLLHQIGRYAARLRDTSRDAVTNCK
jgi:hypothetical protein